MWLELMKYSGRGRVMSCFDSSLMAALSDDMRNETKPSSETSGRSPGDAYLLNVLTIVSSDEMPCVSRRKAAQAGSSKPGWPAPTTAW